MRRVGLIALALLTVVVWIPLVVNLALESPFVRGWLGRLISSQLRARVEFGPVRWYGNFIQVLWADLEFPSVRNVTRWHVEDLRTRLNWKRMKMGGWPMRQASIGLLEVHSRRKSDATRVQPDRAVGTARSTAPPEGGQAAGPSANTRSLPPARIHQSEGPTRPRPASLAEAVHRAADDFVGLVYRASAGLHHEWVYRPLLR
jgi:hypothetical protein